MSSINSFLLFLLVLQLIRSESNHFVRAVELIDDKSSETILGIICDSSLSSRDNQQIARITTIKKLKEFASALGEDHKYHKCAQKNLASLQLLNDVVSNSNANVCSDAKISLIEKYHNSFYASGREFDKLRQEQDGQLASPVLNLFFEHYAMEVSAVCQTSLINNIEWHLQEVFGENINEKLVKFSGEAKDLSFGTLGVVFEGIINKFMQLFTVGQYDDALLIWDLIQGNAMKSNPEAFTQKDSMFDPVTGDLIKLSVKSKASKNFDLLRDHCHFKLKPIYSKLITPLIRLSNLGFLNKGERFQIELKELKTNDNVRRWYAVTQLCEAILPIRSFEDPSMKWGDVIVLTPEEAMELVGQARFDKTLAEQQKPMNYEPVTNSMEHVDLLESVQSTEGQKLVKQVESNLSARDRTRRRMIKNLILDVAHELKSRVGKLLFPKRLNQTEKAGSDDQPEVRDVRQDAKPELVHTIEQLTDEDLDQMSADSSPLKGIVRQEKRRPRRGDYEFKAQERQAAVAVKRTMSKREIFAPCLAFLKNFEPSWSTIILGGLVIIGILVLFLLCSLFLVHGR